MIYRVARLDLRRRDPRCFHEFRCCRVRRDYAFVNPIQGHVASRRHRDERCHDKGQTYGQASQPDHRARFQFLEIFHSFHKLPLCLNVPRRSVGR